jgi:CRISPR/Cas system-associated exonuclease Cas4 (RecB family)
MKTTTTNKNFSHINDMKELKAEIRRLKKIVRYREIELGERIKQLPQETVKATVGSIVPAFLNNSVAGGTLGLLNTVRKLIFNRAKGKDLKEEVIADAKRIGIIALAKGVFGLLRKKKTAAKQVAVSK